MVKSNWYMKMIPVIMVTIICLMFLPFVLGSEEVNISSAVLMDESTIAADDVTIGINGLELNLNAKFSTLGQIAKFEVTINNPTSEEFELQLGNANDSDFITYENDLTDTILEASEVKTFHITLTYTNEVPSSSMQNGSYSEDNTFNIVLSNNSPLEENTIANNTVVENVVEENTTEENIVVENEIEENNTVVAEDETEKDEPKKETIIDKIIDKSNNPKTDDKIMIYLAVSILAIAGTAIFVYYPSRKIYLGATVVTIAIIIILPITTFASVKKQIVVNTNVQIVSNTTTATTVKYAVQIYGIANDLAKEGYSIGLSFGPATGDNYNNKYVTHEYELFGDENAPRTTPIYYVKIVTHTVASDGTETTTSEYLVNKDGEKVTRTANEKSMFDINLHDMAWRDIEDMPAYYFYDCMLCGDTKSVTLTLNDVVGNKRTNTQYGDGAGSLYASVKQYYRLWNPAFNNDSPSYNNSAAINGGTDGSIGKTAGGYSSSHIRATLIGSNDKTDETYAGDVNLNADNCLYSCIEEDLRNVIMPKKVTYVTGTTYTGGNYVVNRDIVDKIWLLSSTEMLASGYLSGEEDGLAGYDKFKDSNSKYYISSYSNTNKDQRLLYNEMGREDYNTCLRSINLNTTSIPRVISRGGVTTYLSGNYQYFYQLSFGFCINAIVWS